MGNKSGIFQEKKRVVMLYSNMLLFNVVIMNAFPEKVQPSNKRHMKKTKIP